MSLKGIDVSYCNGKVDWNVAKNNLNFAIIQLGYGSNSTSQDDAQFERNASECERLHIPWGAYLYSYAMSTSSARSELSHALRLLKGKHPTYPIFIDLEDTDNYKSKHGGIPSTQTNTNIAKIFCEGIVKAGYKAGYYCNRDWYYNHLYPTELKNYAFWYARPEVSAPDIKCDIWQNAFGERTGRWNGANISGKGCDTNIGYTTFGAVKEP
ncbi:MAG TPA: glycosyl hydrolase family 25, partial [Clostridiaceae bacterium]|nr:glycosyl hydrolase family 25 [Clostridiaceae bacterium]